MALHKSLPLVIDRVAFSIKISSAKLYAQVGKQLYDLLIHKKKFISNGELKIRVGSYSKRLDWYAEYGHQIHKRRKIASITVKSRYKKRYLTLTLYPSKYAQNEFSVLKAALVTYMPRFAYAELFMHSKVSYLELAADNLSQRLYTFIPFRNYARVSKIYKDEYGNRGTVYTGSVNSKNRLRVYDKRKQLLDTEKALMNQSQIHTRIELALRTLGLKPVELKDIPNPFASIEIADLEQARAESTDDVWQGFLSDCVENGAPSALAKCVPYRRKTHKEKLRACSVWWWKPNRVWKNFPKALQSIAP